MCKTIVEPAIVFGSEKWAVTEIDMERMGNVRGKYEE